MEGKAFTPSDILNFWFSEQIKPLWFVKNAAFDQEIREMYLEYIMLAADNKLTQWEAMAEGLLALIILLDQFPRNSFRDTPDAFLRDPLARRLTYIAIAKGFDTTLSQEQTVFLYMPLMHSESLEDQKKSVDLYTTLGRQKNMDFAIKHREIVERFGRFPHRNAILGRHSTPEETDFLTNEHSGF